MYKFSVTTFGNRLAGARSMNKNKPQKKLAQYPLRIDADLKNRAQHYALDNKIKD